MQPLISCTALNAIMDEPKLRLIDCRHELDQPAAGRAAFQAGHLPNAVFLHLDEDLSGPLTGSNGRHPLPDPAVLLQKLAQLGINAESHIVVYDANNGAMAAARAWWLLSEWLGFASVQLLDGGLAAWRAQDGAVSDYAAKWPPLTSNASAVQPVTVDVAYVQSTLATAAAPLIIDARSAERYAGIGELRSPVAGHIPGAINRYFGDNLAADGLFKSSEQLHTEWADLLASRPVNQVVAQCGSGVTACHNLLAMKVAGFEGARLYPGSWSEWISDPTRPVTQGDKA